MNGHHFTAGALAILMIAAAACAGTPPPKPGSAAPVIDAVWASPTATWGEIWRVYLKAHDPDGDMQDIRFYLRQAGFTHDDQVVFLNRNHRTQMDGYCYMRIPPSSFDIGFINVTLTVVIFDSSGYKSREATLPLAIGRDPQRPPPPGFSDNALAPISQVPKGKGADF